MTIVEDVVAVLAASTPAGLRTLVEQTPRLLGDEVGDALWLVAGNARADGDPELADHAVVVAALLRRCQLVGTAEAFAEAEERTPEKSRRPRTQNPRRPEAADTSLVDDLHRRCKRVIMSSLFEHAGGYEALHRLEQTFYDSVLTDPLLQPLFGAGQPQHVDHLTAFTAESFGGPDRFTRELGFAHLIAVHRGLRITEEQRQRFVTLYAAALDTAGMPDDPPFRQAVMEHIEFGTQVALQNSHARTDDELHPLREVPHWTWPGDDAPTD